MNSGYPEIENGSIERIKFPDLKTLRKLIKFQVMEWQWKNGKRQIWSKNRKSSNGNEKLLPDIYTEQKKEAEASWDNHYMTNSLNYLD